MSQLICNVKACTSGRLSVLQLHRCPPQHLILSGLGLHAGQFQCSNDVQVLQCATHQLERAFKELVRRCTFLLLLFAPRPWS